MDLKDHIRGIPDFPKPGILFYDISTLLRDADAWQVAMGRMARAVRDRDGVCRAPGCAIPAARCQLDHVVEVRDGGTTRGDTIADGCERHHAKKTRRHWAARITPDGIVEWRLPDGRVYPTFPMDYREFGLGADQPETANAGHDAGNARHDAGREVDDPVDDLPF